MEGPDFGRIVTLGTTSLDLSRVYPNSSRSPPSPASKFRVDLTRWNVLNMCTNYCIQMLVFGTNWNFTGEFVGMARVSYTRGKCTLPLNCTSARELNSPKMLTFNNTWLYYQRQIGQPVHGLEYWNYLIFYLYHWLIRILRPQINFME